MPSPNPKGIYFDSALIGQPTYDYVCWLDVMGTENQMLRSLPISANFIFKLHCAVLEAFDELGIRREIRLYPVMDGVYITSRRRPVLQALLNQALCRLAITFLREETCYHQFLVRGAVAYGPVYHGSSLPDEIAYALSGKNSNVRDQILMGLPMAQAHSAEASAPPFGLVAHSSARAFSPEQDRPFRLSWLNWYRSSKPEINPSEMLSALEKYFTWQRDHANMTGYRKERIDHHLQLAKEFFTVSSTGDVMEAGAESV